MQPNVQDMDMFSSRAHDIIINAKDRVNINYDSNLRSISILGIYLLHTQLQEIKSIYAVRPYKTF